MKVILSYLKDYFVTVNKRILFLSTLFIALFIFINYYYGLNNTIINFDVRKQFISWYFIFLLAFSFTYLLYFVFKQYDIFNNVNFLILLVIAPAIFSWKMVFDIDLLFSSNPIKNAYWNQVFYWPSKLVIISLVIFIIGKFQYEKHPLYGINSRNFKPKPYLLMLVVMIPLVAAASTQPDFLAIYPKLKNISFLNNEHNNSWFKLLYELSYGSDFISIELFFRGFLILAFVKWFGKDAILPMACFYCTIHFGKPLGECISSFFGGLILGVIVIHTKTIFGGLMVHLGIAWMMELGGYLGNLYKQ